MKYLFFDIECANCFDQTGKMYSFGYVLTDGELNLEKKEDIIINPDAPFDWYVKKNILLYTEKEISEASKFDVMYEKIEKLIVDDDVTLLGFAAANDLKFLVDECNRYKLNQFEIKCYDIQIIATSVLGENASKSLTKLAEEIGLTVSELNKHNSADDAEVSFLIFKELCRLREQTPILLLDDSKKALLLPPNHKHKKNKQKKKSPLKQQ